MKEQLPDRIHTLSQIEVFSDLRSEDLEALAELLVEETFLKGSVICRKGDQGNSFFVILSGELEVWGGPEDKQLLARLGPGSPVGEMSLLMGDTRSATLIASQRTVLLVLSKEHFCRYMLNNTKVLEYFSKIICQRLAATSAGTTVGETTLVLSVESSHGLRGKSVVAAALAKLMRHLTGLEVLLVKVEARGAGSQSNQRPLMEDYVEMASDTMTGLLKRTEPGLAELKLDIARDASPSDYGKHFGTLVNKLSDEFTYILFDLVSDLQALVGSIREFTDVLVKIVDAPTTKGQAVDAGFLKTYEVINLFNGRSRPISINACEPFVLPRDSAVRDGAVLETPLAPGAVPLHRLARKILGRSVGIALGGGAAFGLSHLGVLKVLEDNQIPVDLVVGCSMGSMVAVAYASGVSVSEMIDKAHELGKWSKMLSGIDIAISKPGMLAGNRIRGLYTPLLGGRHTFEDLVKPCRTVATDIESGERVEICTGSLEDAYRASISIPVVMSPIRKDGRILVDGGVSDPVPAEVVRGMGADICIAVNVVPPPKQGVEMIISRFYRQLNIFNPLRYLGEGQKYPNMFDITMNSLQTLQYELGQFKGISADVRINPDLSDFTWIEFYRSHEIIDKGMEEAERVLPAIRQAVGLGSNF